MALLPREEHLVTRAGPFFSRRQLSGTSMNTPIESQSYLPVQGPSLLELVGLVAFIAILVSGLLGLLHYAL
jgi:hypothetical protein